MLNVRKSEERGHFDHGWLDTWHTFSFADYFDPEHMGFRVLRVINQDRVMPSEGFGMHPHRDMEIVTYVLSGALEHQDSLGNGSVIRPGEVQRMTAGTGVVHSEYNHSKTEPVDLLQIWILPDKKGLFPSYEQKKFLEQEKVGQLRIIASPDGTKESVQIHQNALIYASVVLRENQLVIENRAGRYGWIQVARGLLDFKGQKLKQGDGVGISGNEKMKLKGLADKSEILFFDLP